MRSEQPKRGVICLKRALVCVSFLISSNDIGNRERIAAAILSAGRRVRVEGDGWRRRRRRWWWWRRHRGGSSSAPFASQTPVMSVYTASTPTPSTAISPTGSTTVTAVSTATTTTTITATASTTTAAASAAAPATTTTATSSTAVSPDTAAGWVEFCERHARASASDFAKAFCTYVSLNLPECARANFSHRDFLRKFVESFCEHFESEYLRQSVRCVWPKLRELLPCCVIFVMEIINLSCMEKITNEIICLIVITYMLDIVK